VRAADDSAGDVRPQDHPGPGANRYLRDPSLTPTERYPTLSRSHQAEAGGVVRRHEGRPARTFGTGG
jgi:hypothetical protein